MSGERTGFWRDKRVAVTGGAGFLGKRVVASLDERGCENVFVPRSRDYDLRDRAAIDRMLADARPDVVIHLAATVGGIGANAKYPATFFYDNAIMGIELIERSRLRGVGKFVCVGTVCSYPKFAPVPFHERDLWNGYPEETNAPYGLAKKMLLAQIQAYRQQHGFNGVYLIPVNLYGPGDNFDPESSHVIPALIRKFTEARRRGDSQVSAWGTGSASREFLHVDDAAAAITAAAERYDSPEPINIGASREITIRELAELIRELTGFEGEIVWDATKPDGQPRRKLDISAATRALGWRPRVSLREGLAETVRRWEARGE